MTSLSQMRRAALILRNRSTDPFFIAVADLLDQSVESWPDLPPDTLNAAAAVAHEYLQEPPEPFVERLARQGD